MNQFYKNPLTTIYHYEYALYLVLTELFRSVECKSKTLETLRIYYAELTSVSASGKCSYEKQFNLEEKCENMARKMILPKIHSPGANTKNAKVSVILNEDKTHTFTFKCGEAHFSYRFVLKEIERKEPGTDSPEETRPEKMRPREYKVFLRVL